MLMWSVIIILVSSGRSSNEAVLFLDAILENKCLAKVQLRWDPLYSFGSKILVLMIRQISLISIIVGWMFDFSDRFETRISLANLDYRCNFFSCCRF
jgi:hypothetical protein